jgi:HD-like signal output (HDOD) protein
MSARKLRDRDLKKVLAAAQLPALPQSAIRLLELSQDPTNGPHDFAIPIESDPGLTGQVLKFVNSSYFGFAREISNIKMSIMLVGIRTIKNFALWSAVFCLMPNPKCGPFDLKRLWQDSLRRAIFARMMAESLGVKDTEEAFAAALLQDMAVPLLAKESPEEYRVLLEARRNGAVRLSDMEAEAFGWTHAEAAGLMGRQWNLPEEFVILIENHLQVEQWLSQVGLHPRRAVVALSALLPSTADSAWMECRAFESGYETIRPAKGSTLLELLEKVDRDFGSIAPVLKVTIPAKTLAATYLEFAGAAVSG